jgi:transposase, IS30 family
MLNKKPILSKILSKNPKYKRLTSIDRVTIEVLLKENLNYSAIAVRLGCNKSTISREVKLGLDCLGQYRASYADKKSFKRVSRRKKDKRRITNHLPLVKFVNDKLKNHWSPDQISLVLKRDYCNDDNMQVSSEAIYQYIYVLPRGELKKTLIEGLRYKHKYRHKRKTKKQLSELEEMRGKIADMLSIHERPPEVAHRIIPGHWESDLIIGKYKQSAVATLVERVSRFTMIIPLSKRDAVSVREAITQRVMEIPSYLRKTLTHDQGKELSQHVQLTLDTNMQVYFADPASPWQRGTNENTNGLIRDFFPKGTDFRLISEERIMEVQDLLNSRPRKVLDYNTPNEVYSSYVAIGG